MGGSESAEAHKPGRLGGLKKHWIKPETKSQSKTNSGNRQSERGGKGVYVHNLGSTSLSSLELQLVSFIILIQINSLIPINIYCF